jgi:hypothetical protein
MPPPTIVQQPTQMAGQVIEGDAAHVANRLSPDLPIVPAR